MTEKKSEKEGGTAISDESLFKVTKEIVVKFIEVGKLSPAGFEETFDRVYQAIEKTVRPK